MKHIICFLIAVAVVFSIFILTVSAEDNVGYDEEELKTTLREALELYTVFFDCYHEGFEGDEIAFYPDPYPGLGRPYTYAIRADKYKLWDDFISTLDAYYTKSVKELFLRKVEATGKDGYTYSCVVIEHAQFPGYIIDGGIFEHEISLDKTFKIISADENKVTAEIGALKKTTFDQVYTFTVEYEKTDAGWRISGGSLIDETIASRNDSPFVKTAPETGSDFAALLILLSVSIVIIDKLKFGTAARRYCFH